MPRRPRLNPVGIPQHIIQRGNNRQACFAHEQDFIVFVHWLKEAAAQFCVDIHAWVLMTNHVHLLATPKKESAISKMMQSLGRKYVRYFNTRYQRTGTLWEGRFKSCLIDSEGYLLECYRYIELNPVRANMVSHPNEYKWSSYHVNALGKQSDLCTPHPVYLSLASSNEKRSLVYRDAFQFSIEQSVIDELRTATQKGLVLGSENFKNMIEELTQQCVRSKAVGRPPKLGSESISMNGSVLTK